MKFLNLFILIAMTMVNTVFCMRNRFTVVSSSIVANEFYPRPTDSRSDEEPDDDDKKQICKSIFSSYEFARHGQYPYEQEDVPFFPGLWLKEKKNYAPKVIRSILIGGETRIVDEFAFVCLTHNGSGGNIKEYYVSTEYNLLMSTRSNKYLAARFVFYYTSRNDKILALHKLAETPAEILPIPRHNDTPNYFEYVYINRREEFMPAFSRQQDSLCRLQPIDKLRICLAVFNSSHFNDLIEYSPSVVNTVDGTCNRLPITLRQYYGRKTAGRKYEEWAMSCTPNESVETFNYLISTAYEDNEIFVYFWNQDTQQMFVEILTINVRILIDEYHVRRREPEKTDNDYEYEN